jgi:hypothetical protein
VCVYVCVYMSVNASICVYEHTCVCARVGMCACVCVCVSAFLCVYVRLLACIRVRLCVHARLCEHVTGVFVGVYCTYGGVMCATVTGSYRLSTYIRVKISQATGTNAHRLRTYGDENFASNRYRPTRLTQTQRV